MSLFGKDLQMVDTFNVSYIIKDDDGVARKLFSGSTSKATLDSKVDKIEVFSGIGQQKTFSLFTKKDLSLDVEIEEFDLNYIAMKHGVFIDKSQKGTFVVGKSYPVTALATTILKCTRLINLQDEAGVDLKIVATKPSKVNEVQVVITAGTAVLTLEATSTVKNLVATFEGEADALKDNYTISFGARAFPKGGELICQSIAYDSTPSIVGDIYLNFYNALLDPNGSLDFSMGKATKIPAKFEILRPRKLPDGSLNIDDKLGNMIITER
ncbi:hypothetical protein [Clostridium tagluense]|uniref:Uncharacterized protein n=1 Tax=Clostridium tagluense TaxID=360422 RepID=A0A401ULN1_9CLOT|nr:hypothetical protein [Clostridium tagluense]GCD10441.1 hypothetical protein Ctaglu_20640 [Clostridium tagluense]